MSSIANVWTNNGTVISDVTHGAWQPRVIYEGNAQILSGNVFKMLYARFDGSGICYAESSDGVSWTNYSSNPVISNYTYLGGFYKVGSTYYAYMSPLGTLTKISAYTSPDGINWTKQVDSALTDSTSTADAVYQLNVIEIDANGKWWGMYAPIINGAFPGKIATSTDGLNWTIETDYPALSTGYASTFLEVNDIYYGWGQTDPQSWPGRVGYYPTDISRWSSPSPGGPWTPLGSLTYHRTISSEQPNNVKGQVADPTIIYANGNMYMFYDCGSNDTTFAINGAVATGISPAELVATYEGIVDVPIPGSYIGASEAWHVQGSGYSANGTAPALNFSQSATDTFVRANGGLGANWTSVGTTGSFVDPQIVSDKVTSTTAGDNADAFYTGTWANDQWASVTLATLAASSYIGVCLRTSAGNGYRFVVYGATGSSATTWYIQKNVSGTITNLLTGSTFSGGPFTPAAGDIISAAVVGTQLFMYYNGSQIATISDATFSSGAPGLAINPTTATSNAYISLWSGGVFQSASSVPAVPTFVSGYNQTLVQSNAITTNPNGTNETSLTLAYNSNNAVGNLLIAIAQFTANPAGDAVVTDSQSNTWVALPRIPSSTYNLRQAFYCLSAKSGANTITITYPGTGSNYLSLAIMEFAGTYLLGTHAEAQSDSTHVIQASTMTTQPNSLLIGYGSNYTYASISAPPWFIAQVPIGGTAQARGMVVEYVPGQGPGTYTTAMKNDPATNHWGAGIISFYSAAIPSSSISVFQNVVTTNEASIDAFRAPFMGTLNVLGALIR